DTPAVNQDRAGTALAVIAAFFRAGQIEMIAQNIEKRGSRIERQPVNGAVHGEFYRDSLIGASAFLRSNRGGASRNTHGHRDHGGAGHDFAAGGMPIGSRRSLGFTYPAELGVCGRFLGQSASPMTKANAMLRRAMSLSSRRPIKRPIRVRRTVTGPSAITWERARKPFRSLGSIVMGK